MTRHQTTTTTEAKEATMSHTISTPIAVPASEAGALSGHEVRCSCGLTIRTSLSAAEAAFQGEKHLAWAEKVGR